MPIKMAGCFLLNTEIHEAHLGQLEQDVVQLRQNLVKLKQDKAALITFVERVQRRNLGMICIVLIASAIGWFAGGSNWLRWYVVPIVLMLCGLFSVGAAILTSYTARKITRLEDVAFNAEIAITQFKNQH
jgi:TctA family transporter